MVNMIGFHHDHFAPKPIMAAFGEPGHYFTFRPLGGTRAKVAFPCGSAVFDSPDDARHYLDHPGDISHAARYYLENIPA